VSEAGGANPGDRAVYLADTSTWHWARVEAARNALQIELDAGRIETCAIIDAELIVSARGPADADTLIRRSPGAASVAHAG
jgi:predicted nucleic acid-binding protein